MNKFLLLASVASLAGPVAAQTFAPAQLATIPLQTAWLKTLKPGAVVYLQPGSYPLDLAPFTFAPAITITSADPAHPAVLTKLKTNGGVGLHLSHLDVLAAADGNAGFVAFIKNSQDITFDHVHVHGSADGDPSNDGAGIQFNGSTNVAVTNSEFDNVSDALSMGAVTNGLVANNSFHDIRIDGVEMVVVDQVKILGNSFKDFHHLAGDHSDAIQFWTSGQTHASADVEIGGNAMDEGLVPGSGFQGVFIADEANVGPHLRFNIHDNAVVGGNWNGISLSHVAGATLTNNYLVALVRPKGSPLATDSRLRLDNSTGVVLTNNAVSVVDSDVVLTQSGTTFTAPLAAATDAAVRCILAAHMKVAATNILAVFAATPGTKPAVCP